MSMVITIITSIVAGLFNAFSGIFQRKGIGSPKAKDLYSKHQIAKTSKNKFWQIGAIAESLAAVFELIALYYGNLLIVEPLLMTNLVFLLIIVHFRLKKPVSPREWIGIISTCVGISLFLIIANPHGGQAHYGFSWVPTILIICTLLASGAAITRKLKTTKQRGALGALTGGLSLGLTAALTRLTMIQFHTGIMATMTHWPLYALLISATVSLFAVQIGYGSGPLTITQPVLEITSPIISVLLGLFMFGDSINTSPLAILIELLSFLLAVMGVALLGSSKRVIKFETSPALAPIA
jgi:uncharacterized membrane protein